MKVSRRMRKQKNQWFLFVLHDLLLLFMLFAMVFHFIHIISHAYPWYFWALLLVTVIYVGLVIYRYYQRKAFISAFKLEKIREFNHLFIWIVIIYLLFSLELIFVIYDFHLNYSNLLWLLIGIFALLIYKYIGDRLIYYLGIAVINQQDR